MSKDQMRSGFSLVANHSRIIMNLTDIPVYDWEVFHDFACTSIFKAICQVNNEDDCMYNIALRFGEDI